MQGWHVDQGVNRFNAGMSRIEPAHAYRTDEYEPDAIVDRLESNEFTPKQPGHIPFAPQPSHIATGLNAFDHVRIGIGEFGLANRVSAQGGLIMHCGGLSAAESLMRALGVINLAKAVKRTLLLLKTRLHATAAFERAVQAFVPAILLRTPRVNAFRDDPQLDPPQREPGQSPQATRAERFAVVRADSVRQPVVAKRALA